MKKITSKFLISSIFLIIISVSIFSGCEEEVDTNAISGSGNIEATNIVISSKTPGQIKEIYVKEGDMVKAGDVLFLIDHDLLDIQLRQALAAVEQADAQLKLLQQGARSEDIRIAEDNVSAAEINLKQAETDLQRMKNLVNENAATVKNLEDAELVYDLRENQLNSAEENLMKVRTIIRREEVESAAANLKRSQANADLIRKNIEDCKVSSPLEGIITKKLAEPGEFVNTGSSILNIADLKVVDLFIYVTEAKLGKIKLGQEADITNDTYPDKKYSGEVIYISPEAEFTPKNIQTKEERTKLVFGIKIRIPNASYELKSGMPADANIILN
ncbi:MAG TPA: efflux RND transporter periplasmic adaptor subunit [Ignavibacteria bacterium]|nr:efflux RND transporter periplasmic adaptor subunit [Ignavibacteria bacterium]HQY50866.1 efflux RND transporter periplasmic adaptor subunit [Ignavibacteria bacterium]